jgi:hypothetical protein
MAGRIESSEPDDPLASPAGWQGIALKQQELEAADQAQQANLAH